LVLTLVFGLVTLSIIPAAPPDVTGRCNQFTTSRSVAKLQFRDGFIAARQGLRVVGPPAGSFEAKRSAKRKAGEIKATGLT